MAKDAALVRALRRYGYVRAKAQDAEWLPDPSDRGWAPLAADWPELELDRYMADGGRYRRRRHAALRLCRGAIEPKPAQPHFQSLDYNPLNGNVERWFAPMRSEVLHDRLLADLLLGATACFEAAGTGGERRWHVELHQFRIEAGRDREGLPTPEGMHRDGVEWGLVLLISRDNVRGGTTRIRSPNGDDAFTLNTPGDALLFDDRRILHGVTPIQNLDPSRSGSRDVLVATWRSEPD